MTIRKDSEHFLFRAVKNFKDYSKMIVSMVKGFSSVEKK